MLNKFINCISTYINTDLKALIKSYEHGIFFENNITMENLKATEFSPNSFQLLFYKSKMIFDKIIFITKLGLRLKILEKNFILINVC